jgi:hypothetical protein
MAAEGWAEAEEEEAEKEDAAGRMRRCNGRTNTYVCFLRGLFVGCRA